MLPPRALLFPSHAHDHPLTVEVLNLCADRDLHTLTPLQLGLTHTDSSQLCLLVEAARARDVAAWIDRLHSHHAHAGLLLDEATLDTADMLTTHDIRALPGLGMWPVFTCGTASQPLITLGPAEITRALDALPLRTRTIAPHPNALHIATDALLLDALARHDITQVILPPLQLTTPSHPAVHSTRYRRVSPDEDIAESLLAWLQGDRIEQAKTAARVFGRALRDTASDLRRRAARKSGR